MSNLNFMSDQRREDLIKAASDCIDLMNLGVEPNQALKKVAADSKMNDKEVVLVSHAVNNAKVLSHIQDTKGDERGKPFPLTNAEELTGTTVSGDVETKSDSAQQAEDQPDALDITKSITKQACAQADKVMTSYRNADSMSLSDLRDAWGLTSASTATVDAPEENPYAAYSLLKQAADDAAGQATSHRELACEAVDQLVCAFTKIASPDYALFEEAARRSGVSDEALDLVYDFGEFEEIGINRKMAKVASDRLYISQDIAELVKIAQEIDLHVEAAADRLTARNLILEQIQEGEVKLAALPKAVFDIGSVLSTAGDTSARMTTLGDDLAKGIGLSEAPDSDFMDSMSRKGEDAEIPKLDINIRQKLENASARDSIEELMADDYIGRHPLTDVVEAYNLARSVNPRFGKAELQAYIRQHLANRGAMPLDLLLKARKSQQPGSLES